MTEWQPIETAPKDGTAILLFWPNYSYDGSDQDGGWAIDIGRWVTNSRLSRAYSNGAPRASAEEIAYWDERQMTDSYFSNTDEMDCYGLAMARHAPSHWMPLPAPPTSSS